MAEDAIRRRAACDRCHSQKIRCPRKAGQDVCDRCQKARTPCIFSPFRQKKISEEETEKDESSVVSLEQPSIVYSGAISDNVSSSNRKRQRLQGPIAGEESVSKLMYQLVV